MWRAVAAVFKTAARQPAVDERELMGDEAEGEEGDEEEELISVVPVGFAGRVDPDDFNKRARKEIKALVGKLAGCEQLAPEQPRLLTTQVGNWGIRGAIRALRDGSFDDTDDPRRAPSCRLVPTRTRASPHAASAHHRAPPDHRPLRLAVTG